MGSHLLEEEAFSRAACFVHDSINIGVEKTTTGYDLAKDLRLNIFLMDELKLFGKSEDQIDSLVQTVQLLNEDIRMEMY